MLFSCNCLWNVRSSRVVKVRVCRKLFVLIVSGLLLLWLSRV